MARKKTSGRAKSFSEAIGLQYIFNNTITDFFLGLALVVMAMVLIIAMVSFINTGAADQSLLENLRPGEWTNTEKQFQNYCGSLGAIISYWLMAVNFGFPAFLLPCFVVMAGFQLMHVYNINLWKWFLSMMIIMIWSSITFAKFLTPLMGSLIFNPGGKHGLYVVQNLENVVGPPGLTAILLFVAVAFLTYLTTETITIVRKALNPIGYISNKVKFEITNHGDSNTEDIDLAYQNAERGRDTDEEDENATDQEKPEMDEGKQDIPTPQNNEEKKSQVVDLDANKEEKEEKETEGSVANAAVNPTEPIATTTTPSATPSFLEMKRKQRAEKAERERMEMEAAAAASEHVGMDISVALGEEKATSNTVSNAEVLNTPINPKEPFTKYKYPTLNLLKKYDDQEVSIDEEEQKANKNRIIEVLNNFGVQIKTIRATVGPTITLYEIQPAEGVRISKIKNLEDDIALSLAALGIRIIAPIPGKGTIGIEVPNAKANIVSMESILN